MITKSDFLCRRRDPLRPDVTTWVGSMSHIAQTFSKYISPVDLLTNLISLCLVLIGALHNGACTIQPSRTPFSSAELIDMVHRCQLNCLRLFGTFLSTHIRNSRANPILLTALKSLDEAFFCGVALEPEDEAFALQQGIRLRNIFGSTEVGAMLASHDGERFMRQLSGTKYAFRPVDSEKELSGSGARNANNTQLRELIILRESPDCPNPALCDKDGNYCTGDLFQEVLPGQYVFRGRNDDWIKSENSLRIDTK
jgi:acyl-coenzyme A synthetase/AMP-(fatty) acid ligase